jgi:hypothetical protein
VPQKRRLSLVLVHRVLSGNFDLDRLRFRRWP